MGVFKVSHRSRSTAVAGAIAGVIREGSVAEVQAIGAGAVHQAVKSIISACRFLTRDGIAVVCIPAFVKLEIDGRERTALKFTVQRPEQPIPPVVYLPHAEELEASRVDAIA